MLKGNILSVLCYIKYISKGNWPVYFYFLNMAAGKF